MTTPLAPPVWPEGAAALIAWYVERRPSLPREPFRLGRAVRVIHPERFYAALDRGIEAGPKGPRGRTGAILFDLSALRAAVDSRAALNNHPT